MIAYIAGKINGDSEYRGKFAKARHELERAGYTVLNPAILPPGLREDGYMRIALAMLDSADIAAFLPDFRDSPGAQVEYALCVRTGKPRMLHTALGWTREE